MHRYIILLVIFIVLSCNADRKPPKQYRITEDQLIDVLVDIHLIFAIQTAQEYRDLTLLYDSVDLHTSVFTKHHIDKAAFDSTLSYYTRKPETLIEIYDEVIMKLSKLQDSISQSLY